MRNLKFVVAILITMPVLAQQNPLRQAVAEGAKSIAWKIRTDGVSICCCNDERWETHNHTARIEHVDILLAAYFSGQHLTRVRMFEPECAVHVDRLLTATPEQSLDFLLEHLRDDESVVAALAMHDDPRVIPELIALARKDPSTKVRRDALFWLGQRAGEKAADELRRAVDEDPEDEVREHAVFAISQLPAERSVPILIDLVKHHKRPAIRKRAMFWLTQTGDPRALELIEEILGVQ